MIRILLPSKEVERLEHVLRASDDPKLRARVQIVPMAHRGRPHGQIAYDTGTSRSSVQRKVHRAHTFERRPRPPVSD